MDLTGQQLDQYEIIELIGQGGMATVYRAYQANLNRNVAIKVLPLQHMQVPGFGDRFLREAKAIAQLSHPNILPIYDVNLSHNISYLVMKYVSGRTLWDLVGQPLPLTQVSQYIGQVAGALDHAHRRGVLHRDIKPSNILLEEDEDWLLLADFGLAKILEGSEIITNPGELMGTPTYMSPEQGQGRAVDHRTDIYSLGIVLYQMVAGRVPFEGDTTMGLVYKHIHELPPPPRQFRPDLPQVVERVILRAIAKDPAYRFDRAGDLAEALHHAISITSSTGDQGKSSDTEAIIPEHPPQKTGGLVTPQLDNIRHPSSRSNPYTNRAVIKDPAAFFGRSAELHDLFTLLAGMQSCSVVGPRRIGKSSLLYYLTHPSTYVSYLPDPTNYIFAFVDLQELAGLGPDDFCWTVVERFDRASQGRLKANLEQDGTRAGFRRFLMRVTDADLRLVLCCDEFEMLSDNANFSADFFAYLRGLCSNYNLTLVTSSRSSLFDLCHQGNLQTSQFWNIFVERTLKLMPENEARLLMTEPFAWAGASVSEEDISFGLKLAGFHPFFIQIVCYHLFAAKLTEQPIDFATIEQRFFSEARPHFVYAWSQLDQDTQAGMVAVAQAKLAQMDSRLFQQLSGNGLLTGTPQSPVLLSEGLRRFIIDEETQAAPGQSPMADPTKISPPTPPEGS